MWKDIRNFEGRYEISIDGRVRNKKSNRELSQKTDKYGYKQISIRLEGERKKYWYRIHRLVYEHFSEMLPLNYSEMQVDHIDRNRTNNNFENLRLASCKENCLSRKLSAWSRNKTTGELYITKQQNGYMVRVNRTDYKFACWFNNIDSAILCRDKILSEIRALGK